MPDPSLEEAVKRSCEALISGNLAQIFIDLTPQAMYKLSQSAGPQVAGGIPRLTAYEVTGQESTETAELYDVRFTGDVNFGVRASWQQVEGKWKIVDFEPYQW